MANNEACSTFVTGKCSDKEIRAVCGRFEVEVVLFEPYMMFDISDDCEVNNGNDIWYTMSAGKGLVVSAHDNEINTGNKTYTMRIKSDNIVESIKFVSDTYKTINIISCDDLIDGNKMCYNLERLESFNMSGFNQIVDFTSMFENCFNLTYVNNFFVIPEDLNGDITNVMPRMFRYTKSLKKLPNIDFSLSTNMDYTFSHMHSIEEFNPLVINQNFTANGMFAGNNLPYQPILNYENITSAIEMFRYMKNVEYFSDINLVNSVDVSGAFMSCHKAKSIYGLKIGTTAVKDLFLRCYELKCVDEIDTSNATDLPTSIFGQCYSLLVPLPTVAEEIETTGLAFDNQLSCPPLKSEFNFYTEVTYTNERDVSFVADVDLIVDWGNSTNCGDVNVDVSLGGTHDDVYSPDGCEITPGKGYHVTYGRETFAYKAGTVIKYDKEYDLVDNPRRPIKIYTPEPLTSIKFLPNSSITGIKVERADTLASLDEFAMKNTALDTVIIPDMLNTLVSAVDAFNGCTSLTTVVPKQPFIADMTRMYMNSGISGSVVLDVTRALNIDSVFEGCDSITSIRFARTQGVVPSSGITNAMSAFKDCTSLSKLQYFHSELVTDFSYTFSNTAIKRFDDYVKFDSGVKFTYVFKDMKLLECIKIIDTTNSTDNTGIFDGCISLLAPFPTEVDAIESGAGLDYTNPFQNCVPTISEGNFELVLSGESNDNFFTADNDCLVISDSSTYTIKANSVLSFADSVSIASYTLATGSNITTFNASGDILEAHLNKYDTITSLHKSFFECLRLATFKMKDTELQPSVINTCESMFEGCVLLYTVEMSYFPALTNASKMFKDCAMLSSDIALNAPMLTNISSMFESKYGFADTGDENNPSYPTPIEFKVSFVYSPLVSNMDRVCYHNYNVIDFNMNMGNVVTAQWAFFETYSLSIVVDWFDESKLLNAHGMFSASKIYRVQTVNDPSLVSPCTDYGEMFYRNGSVTYVQLAKSDNGTNFNSMFYYSKKLICLNQLNTTNMATSASIFSGNDSMLFPDFVDRDKLEQTGGYDYASGHVCDGTPIPKTFSMNLTVMEDDSRIVLAVTDNFMISITNSSPNNDMPNRLTSHAASIIPADLEAGGGEVQNTASITANAGDIIEVYSYGSPDQFMIVDGNNVDTITINKGSTITNCKDACSGLSRLSSFVFPDYYNNVTNCENMFKSCYMLENFEFNTAKVTTMKSMFASCRHKLGADGEPFAINVTKCTDISYMFNWCDRIKEVRFERDPGANATLTEVRFAFNYAQSLTRVTGLETGSVQDFTNMFSNTALFSVPSMSIRNATTLDSMFSGCTALTTSWILPGNTVTSMNSMFAGCTSLSCVKGIDSTGAAPSNNKLIFENCQDVHYPTAAEIAQIEGASGLNYINPNTCG